MSKKKCPKCEQTKCIDDFGSDSSRVSGRTVYCKDCNNKLNKEYHEKVRVYKISAIPKGVKIRNALKSSKVRKLGIDLVDIDSSRISGYEDIEFARNYIDSL